ncbi:alpha/beta hydrolase [Novosphingobium lentum]|uniref:alpha/beta hydrolase n=1 Tax=Novosphingobium lentum TaxID=145287 RepID=UPI0008350DE3|nr:alpha/beta hydrolase [Novosphingobium lentum]
MTTRHLVDPAVLPALEAFPPLRATRESLPAIRAAMDGIARSIPVPSLPVDTQTVLIPASEGHHVRAILLRPQGRTELLPAILHIHGGAYIIGAPEMSVPELTATADQLGVTILSVDYRLAPEHPFPAGIEDCYTALGWLHDHAATLGVDRSRIAVMGESAGGGLAASLALLARDRGVYPLAFQLLDAPMMDDRTCVRPRNPVTGEFIFAPEDNHFGWSCLLDAEPGAPGVSPYAAAARETELAGLPPTLIATGALDLFVDENVDYAMRLIAAGVAVELHVYPGCPHGYVIAADAPVSQRALQDKRNALRRALAI